MNDHTKPPIPAMGLLAEAVARYESGLLVHGDQVTDLLTGFSLTMPPAGPADAPRLEFRGSGLDLQELDDLTELITQVMQQRMASPHAEGLDSGIPRDHFPYGLSAEAPDVLITGAKANPIAAYLRSAGFRARVVDTQYAMALASNLAVAQQELAALAPDPAPSPDGAAAEPASPREEGEEKEPRALPLGASPVMAAFVVIIIVAGAMAAGLALDATGNRGEEVQAAEQPGGNPGGAQGPDGRGDADRGAAGEAEAGDAEDRNRQPETPPPFTPKPNRPGMQEPKLKGGLTDGRATARAEIPVAADWPAGWRLASATPQRETYQSDKDAGMRVLLAAKPAPLKNQQELDKAVLEALKDAPGTKVASQSPVSYREKYPDSETLWFVRLVDGHQVSIGCQYREPNPVRSKVCEQVVDSARPER